LAGEPWGRGRPFLARRLADLPELRRDVEAAERLGVSLRRLYGWEPATTYEHDEAGHLVSSRPEPEWTDEQREWLLALADYRRLLCPCGCGHLAEESLKPENEGRFRVGPPVRCQARTATLLATKAYEESPTPGALLFAAELT
jgi:hypothetical protein